MACRLTGAKPLSEHNVGLLLIGPLGTNFSEIFIEILIFSFKKMHLKVSSAIRRPFCLGLDVLSRIIAMKTGTEKRWPMYPWCRHQMETFSALLAICEVKPLVTGGFPSQRPVTWSCYVFFGLCLNKCLSKQSRCQWFQMLLCSLWRQCYVNLAKASTELHWR